MWSTSTRMVFSFSELAPSSLSAKKVFIDRLFLIDFAKETCGNPLNTS